MQDNNADYIIDNTDALNGRTPLPKSSIRMYPYNMKYTRTSSIAYSPLRFWFNMPTSATLPLTYIPPLIGTDDGKFRVDYAQSLNSPYQ